MNPLDLGEQVEIQGDFAIYKQKVSPEVFRYTVIHTCGDGGYVGLIRSTLQEAQKLLKKLKE